jgi:hypothetical protein
LQNELGGLIGVENPRNSDLWRTEILQDHLEGGMVFAKADLCRFGLKSKNGKELLRKPISLLTNSLSFPEDIEKTCAGDHDHRVIQGVETAHSAAYPTAFATAVLRTYDKKTTWEFLLKKSSSSSSSSSSSAAPAPTQSCPADETARHTVKPIEEEHGEVEEAHGSRAISFKGKEFIGLLFEHGF